ncbi:AraC family transcriptional regulator [Pseudoruegeria sp. M32A2M]|nr:AraC family transcriptional regulator [Pseudoruegeria sp. M32A2M]
MEIVVRGEEVHFHYDIPSSGMLGYPHYAIAAVRYIQTIAAPYFPPDWVPLRIEFDFPKPRHAALFEDSFRCPVVFDAPRWALVIHREPELLGNPMGDVAPTMTLSDLHRQVRPAAPTDLPEKIRELVRVQMLDGQVDIERAGAQLGLGVRTLQRRLDAHNLVFRDLVLRTRLDRACELLRETQTPITEIAMMLGYASPANFSRAFRQGRGVSPGQFRAHRFAT